MWEAAMRKFLKGESLVVGGELVRAESTRQRDEC